MTDRTGMSYEELLKIQEIHLTLWKTRVRADFMKEIEQYLLATNQPAVDPLDKHRVFRGQDLIELIRTWPDINPVAYPAKQSSAEALI